MRAISSSLSGLWSLDNGMGRPPRERTARESPQFATIMCLGSTIATTAVVPTASDAITRLHKQLLTSPPWQLFPHMNPPDKTSVSTLEKLSFNASRHCVSLQMASRCSTSSAKTLCRRSLQKFAAWPEKFKRINSQQTAPRQISNSCIFKFYVSGVPNVFDKSASQKKFSRNLRYADLTFKMT
eukprot:TRINITY_DN4947_c0_g1_i2.p1 TRINITY_DN4947_c0_g1~~TRINITY_DN4947_c0_g1_i2.p1  ORF type:complete len:183 (+),score=0.02 TRINITY_DN4947_c0_g1_i2:1528-2076(+)